MNVKLNAAECSLEFCGASIEALPCSWQPSLQNGNTPCCSRRLDCFSVRNNSGQRRNASPNALSSPVRRSGKSYSPTLRVHAVNLSDNEGRPRLKAPQKEVDHVALVHVERVSVRELHPVHHTRKNGAFVFNICHQKDLGDIQAGRRNWIGWEYSHHPRWG